MKALLKDVLAPQGYYVIATAADRKKAGWKQQGDLFWSRKHRRWKPLPQVGDDFATDGLYARKLRT